jgi:hypothetical protein
VGEFGHLGGDGRYVRFIRHPVVCWILGSHSSQENAREHPSLVEPFALPGYVLLQKRGALERQCANPECGRAFVPARRDARACSRRCRDRLAYLRRRERP